MAGMRLYQEQLPILFPHTFAGLQKLVMAMANVHNDVGKKTWFGRDKGAIAYQKFRDSLRQTIIGMTLDGRVRESSSTDEVIDSLVEILQKFSLAFPNWQDAYQFATFFFSQSEDCRATIERLRS